MSPEDTNTGRLSVFISYAHKDNNDSDPNKRWLDRLMEQLESLRDQISAWSDTQIETGDDWHQIIESQLKTAKVAVLLVGPSFLASKYIRNSELPVLLMNAKNRGVTVLPIIVRHCLISEVKFKYPDPESGPEELSLSVFQAANRLDEPLNALAQHEQDRILSSIARRIVKIAQQTPIPPPLPPVRNLADLLGEYYSYEGDVRYMADLACMRTTWKTFEGSIATQWRRILNAARKLQRLDVLVNAFKTDIENYGWTVDLSELEEAKKQFLNRIDSQVALKGKPPQTALPNDYQPILFTESGTSRGGPKSLPQLISNLDDINRVCCVVAHYQQDVQVTFQDLEQKLTDYGFYDSEMHAVWVSGDELWDTAMSEPPDRVSAVENAILRQLWTGELPFENFLSNFDRLLDLDEGKYLFMIDFSLSRSNLNSLSDTARATQATAILNKLLSFLRRCTNHGHTIMMGLTRQSFSHACFQRLIESVSAVFWASDLFSDERGRPVPDDLYSYEDESRFYGWREREQQNEKPDQLTEGLPRDLATVLEPLLSPNSYALRRWFRREIPALRRALGQQDINQTRLKKEVLGIAARLANSGFLEPAFRLELWVKAASFDYRAVTLSGEIRPPDSRRGQEVYGDLPDLTNLPIVHDRIILTGESGQGKTTSLRLLEKEWSLPRLDTGELQHPAWLPIFLFDVDDPALVMADYWKRLPQQMADASGAILPLAAHAALASTTTTENISWQFGSPILFLIDGVRNAGDGSAFAHWMERLSEFPSTRTGLVVSYPDINEVPVEHQWFKRTFKSYREVRLQKANLAETLAQCEAQADRDDLERLFCRIGEPLNEYVRNRFLARCIRDVDPLVGLPVHCSLYDLMERFVLSELPSDLSQQDEILFEERLPAFAHARFTSNGGGNHDDAISRQDIRLGVRYRLLRKDDDIHFAHPLLEQYFLSKHLKQRWSSAGRSFLELIQKTPRSRVESRYLNLLRFLMVTLSSEERESLVQLMRQLDFQPLAHRCLLELPPKAYYQDEAAMQIRDELAAALHQSLQLDTVRKDTAATVRKRRETALALSYYDPRTPDPNNPLNGFVPINLCDGLLFAKFPVTNLEFYRFIQDNGYDYPEYWTPAGRAWRDFNRITLPTYWTDWLLSRPNAPIVGISFHEAVAYANWLTRRCNGPNKAPLVFRIPTGEEWLFAASPMVKNLLEGMIKDQSPDEVSVRLDEEMWKTITAFIERIQGHGKYVRGDPVGLTAATSDGLFDLLGSIWQWCDSWYGIKGSNRSPSKNEDDLYHPILVRGGTVKSVSHAISALYGGGLDRTSRVFNVGFRLVCDLPARNSAAGADI